MRKPSISLGKINIVFFTMVTGWTFINEEAECLVFSVNFIWIKLQGGVATIDRSITIMADFRWFISSFSQKVPHSFFC